MTRKTAKLKSRTFIGQTCTLNLSWNFEESQCFPRKIQSDKRRRKLIEGGVIIYPKIAIDTEVQKTSSKIRCVNQPHLQTRSQSKWKLETRGSNITLFGHPKTLNKTLKVRFLEVRYCLEGCFFVFGLVIVHNNYNSQKHYLHLISSKSKQTQNF